LKTTTFLGWAAVAVLSVITFGIFAVAFFIVYYTYHGGPKGRRALAERMEVQLLQAQLQRKELTNKLVRLDIPTDTLKKTGMIGEQSEQSKLASSMQKICRHCKALAQQTSRFCHICGGSEFIFQSPATQ